MPNTPPAEDKSGGCSWRNIRLLLLWGLASLSLVFPPPTWASSPKLSTLIGKVARQEGLDPNLLFAIVATESQFDIASVSIRGAVGLMQLMPDTARELGVQNRFNPEQNLRGGARYLRQMLDRYPDNLKLALASYNAGPNAVVRFGGVPPFPETKRYISKVLGYYAKMVPGRNRSPKKNHEHARLKPSNSHTTTKGILASLSSKGGIRPEGPQRLPKRVTTFKSLRHRLGSVLEGEETTTPIIRLTSR